MKPRLSVFGSWVALLFLLLPVIIVVPVSFTAERYISLPRGAWSMRHYAALATDPGWLRGVTDGLIVALPSTAIAVALGTACAIGCWRLSTRLSELVRFVMLAPMIVPPIVHALGFYRAWAGFGLIDTYAGLILAHAMKGVPFVVITVSAALATVDLRLEQAARNLGASIGQTLWRVIVPCALPGVWTGALFAFVTSWDEIVVNLFVTSRAVRTLPRQIWDGIQDNLSPSIAAIATVLIALTVVALLARMALASRRAA